MQLVLLLVSLNMFLCVLAPFFCLIFSFDFECLVGMATTLPHCPIIPFGRIKDVLLSLVLRVDLLGFDDLGLDLALTIL